VRYSTRKLLFLLAILLGWSHPLAQDLERARELIDAFHQKTTLVNFDSVYITVSQKNYEVDMTNTIEQFYDFRKNRVFSRAFDDSGNLNNETTYISNQIHTTLYTSGEPTIADSNSPTSVNLQINFASQLDHFYIAIPYDYDIVSYDGLVKYGDIVEGEQVTLSFKDARKNNEIFTHSFIFSEQGDLVGVFYTGKSVHITTMEVFGFGDYIRVKSLDYIIRDNTAYPFHEVREDYRFNQSISKTPFAEW
jgi:hypothetical protein